MKGKWKLIQIYQSDVHFTLFQGQEKNVPDAEIMLNLTTLRTHRKAFNDFKNKQRSVWINLFCYVKVCIFWKSIKYTIHWDKTQMLNNFPSDKINVQKMPSFFFQKLQLITVLLQIYNYYISWSIRFVSLQLCLGFSISDSFFDCAKFYLLIQ